MEASYHGKSNDWTVLFASVSVAARNKRWPQVESVLAEYRQNLEAHFAVEERSLFLVYEKAIGRHEGPTDLMRMEHEHIRTVLVMLDAALKRGDVTSLLTYMETLGTMVQQHWGKKESIRYLMAGETFSAPTELYAGL